jgi:hypothetical protein
MRLIGLAVILVVSILAPLAAGAQQTGRTSRVGTLATANPRVYDDLVDELRKLAYIHGQNLSHRQRRDDASVAITSVDGSLTDGRSP